MISVCSVIVGCSHGKELPQKVNKEEYCKKEYQTTEVIQGQFVPSVKLILQDNDFEKINYKMQKEDLELSSLNVSVGDKVKKGDVLVSFDSKELNDELEEYVKKKENAEALMQHYTNLMKIDATLDYKEDIEMLTEDIEVDELYIKEIRKVLKGYSIVAKRDGVITYIDKNLLNGYYVPSATLITQVFSLGKYTATVEDDSIFSKNEIYKGTTGKIQCNLKLINKDNGKLVFKTIEDVSALLDTGILEIEIEREAIEEAVYIEAHGLNVMDNKYFVYVIDENGFREKRDVDVGETYNGYTIIKKGLSPGEKVAY